ncbi:MAG: Xaa-Pro peptidase family protein [Candidatus Methanomethylicia archaeon]
MLRDVLVRRTKLFQEGLRKEGIDIAVIRALSTFTYFTGVRWLRPALIIPAEGDVRVFVVRGESELFMEKSWIRDVREFDEVSRLMAMISSSIKEFKAKTVGLEFTVERDAYILFYEMFKKINPNVQIKDVHPLTMKLRMIKDNYEIENIKQAGKKAAKGLKAGLDIVKNGASETEIASTILTELIRIGCEEPKVYVNIGPHPRVHAEPFKDIIVKDNVFVTIVVAADYNNYYANTSRSIFNGKPNELAEKAIKCIDEAYSVAVEMSKINTTFINVQKSLDKIYEKYGLINYRLIGYTHGIGLLVEEDPITTIIPQHRGLIIMENMALAMVHTPLMIKGLGTVKREDTFIVGSNKLESTTQ